MDSQELVSSSFVLLHADWTVEKARRVVDGRLASHVIVHRLEGDREYWYLYPIGTARQMLGGAPADRTVGEWFNLHETDAFPVVEALAAPPAAPAIVVDEGRLVGFIAESAATAEPAGGTYDRGGDEGPPPEGGAGGRVRRGPGTLRGGGVRAEPPSAPEERSLQAEFPESVENGSVEWLLVSIVAGPAGSGAIPIALPPQSTVDVLVQARRGFEVEGDPRGSIVVPASGESLPLQFKLRATDEGAGQVRVLCFSLGQPLGVITLTPTVRAAAAARTRGPRTGRAVQARRSKALAPAAAQVPDLSVLIEERPVGADTEYLIRLTALDPALGLNLMPFGPLRLALDPQRFFEDFFAEIEALPLDTAQQRAVAERKLAAKGSYLFETLVPADLQEQLWAVRDRIKSVIVQSEEPWIPWELCKLQGRENGRLVEGPFLCEAYTITRWLPGIGIKRPLTLRNVALVVPEDSGLPLAPAERDYMLSLAARGRRVTAIPATFVDVQDALASGSYDGWHFSGHGAARAEDPDRSSIYLAENEAFTPQDLSGVAANAGNARPLVFLNACQVGRAGLSLTGIGGWARRFVEAGAGAFIGAYWSVYDTPASEFAKEVYGQLIAGRPIGEAVKQARLQIRSAGDPTWLAYTVFADPLASLAT